jgi:hypothetical protein
VHTSGHDHHIKDPYLLTIHDSLSILYDAI